MGANDERPESLRDQLGRLVEQEAPAQRVGREDEAGGSLPASGLVTGLDDVRAPLAEAPSSGFRIRRRDLLAWGGAAALLPAFEGIARAQERGAGGDAPQPMSVGYVEGSDQWASLKAINGATLNRGVRANASSGAQAAQVVPAESLIVGDQSLANEVVRVGVHGLYPIPNPTNVHSVYLTVFYPSPDPALVKGPLPFFPWGYHSRPAPDPAPPVKFLAPLGPDGALSMLLEVTPLKDGGMQRRPALGSSSGAVGGRYAVNFTVDWFAGRPRLQRGLYLLALAPQTWSTARTLPMVRAGQTRPVELLSLLMTFDPVLPSKG